MKLLDHLVGAGEKSRRDREAEGARGPEIDDELELGRLPHREVGWSFSFQNPASVKTGLPIHSIRLVP